MNIWVNGNGDFHCFDDNESHQGTVVLDVDGFTQFADSGDFMDRARTAINVLTDDGRLAHGEALNFLAVLMGKWEREHARRLVDDKEY